MPRLAGSSVSASLSALAFPALVHMESRGTGGGAEPGGPVALNLSRWPDGRLPLPADVKLLAYE